MNRSRNKLWKQIPPIGMFALAAFVICAATGIMLVPAYNSAAALDSLALLLLKNPVGVIARSLHYWSAQAFLALTIAHIVDHLLRRSETAVRFGIWVRLGLTVPVAIAIMLSGFLLRADAPAVQALPVLRTLLGYVPLVGSALRQLFTGSGADLSTIYLHHACTATLILWLITVEHARRILPGARSLAWVLPPLLVVSLLLVPGLEWRAEAVEKGPWYLVGLQEMLHWMPEPQVVIWLGLAAIALLIFLPKFPMPSRTWVKWTLGITACFYAALTLVALGIRGDDWRLMSPLKALASDADFLSWRAYVPPDAKLLQVKIPFVGGQREGCLACHQTMTGFVPAHDPGTVGCAACHLGNPWTLDKALAHSGMTLTPGNLSVVSQTCGASNCHGDQMERVRGSLMNTMSGVIAVDKFVFRQSGDLDAHFDVAALKHSPADMHLRTLCASCHLGQEKLHPGPMNEEDRGGGCSACHLRYDKTSESELHRPVGASAPLHHPDISVHVPGEACFGCHSRSGRISTSYEGCQETLLDETAARVKPGWPSRFRVLSDGRVFEKHPADVHADKGMTCVDCHLASEVMGDRATHDHENNSIKIACADCHAAGKTVVRDYAQLDVETQEIVAMRKLNEPGRKFAVANTVSVAYPNVFLDADGLPVLSLIESGKTLKPKPMAKVCAGSIHSRLECSACHTAWAPQCISCHTTLDRGSQSWDYLAGKYIKGSWQEQAAGYLADAPALGVERVATPNGKEADRIVTFIPGMILNLQLPNGNAAGRNQFRRLFAPASAHTTVAKARDCRSCHSNPLALGYGRGRLNYVVAGRSADWQFTPEYSASSQDGLPADAWIGFLSEPHGNLATRKDARPFTLDEQRRILLVGACLTCHNERQPRVAAAFADFKDYRSVLSHACVLPAWANTTHKSMEVGL